MKSSQSLKKLIVFILPWVIIIGGICCVTPSNEFKYAYLKNDCSAQPRWIYKTLFVDTQNIDIAFFGSSHTIRAINDSLLNALQPDVHYANFGYCRFGRDVQYELFREVVEKKKLKAAFFEITETEPSYSHPVYNVLGKSSDIFIPAFMYNQDFYKNRCDAFLMRLSYLRSKIYKPDTSINIKNLNSFGYVSNKSKADSTYLQNQKEEKLKDLRTYKAQTIARKVELSFSIYYLNKIKELAAKNNCKLYFIYLPAYGNEVKNSLDSAFYKPYFESLIPPDSILTNYKNWQDEAHFNTEGGTKLTNWVLRKIKNN